MKIFITGSTDGLGKLAAIELLKQGHQVVLHARNAKRRLQILEEIESVEEVLIADLSNIEETKRLGTELNARGEFDAIIHNAGVYRAPRDMIFTVNCLAPYILTSLVERPKRLVYMSSGMHRQGNPNLEKLRSGVSYSDSKLLLVMLSMVVARKWPEVYSNAVNPGWVPTKMGGAGAPDDLHKGVLTQVWLAASNDPKAKVSGRYFFHKHETDYNTIVKDITLQDKFLDRCEEISGIPFPDRF